LLLFLLIAQVALFTTSSSGYELFQKSPVPDCSSSSPAPEVASNPVGLNNAAACALACTVATARWCFGFYMTKSNWCRLVRYDAFIKSWLDTAHCPESIYVLPMPAQFQTAVFVSYVTIYNRNDCCTSRMNKLSLRMDGVECHRVDVSYSVANFTCNAIGSRFRVYSTQSQAVNICEIEFFGH
uniref:FTP domain-containing protein n=1 Tax=Macrostomum lignano TaxID=282301 RepID=A0A1I8J310_9PLAT